MNPTVLAAAVTVVIQLVGMIWFAGRSAERQKENGERLNRHDAVLENHRVRLDGVDVELAKMESWQVGYAAGKKGNNHG